MKLRAVFVLIYLSLPSLHVLAQPPATGASTVVIPKHPQVSADPRIMAEDNVQAPIKIVEFFDYQCPFCASTSPALQQFLQTHSGKVQLILKNDPLPIHPGARLAHEAALAAAEQGKFWEMHDLIFGHQHNLSRSDLVNYARQLHLDVALFQKRLDTGFYQQKIAQDIALAQAVGVTGTPTFFINGNRLVGAQSLDRFEAALSKKEDARAPIAVADLDLSHSPSLGPSDAPVTIVEFSDLQCPFCASVVPTLQDILKEYPGQVRWVFKSFPLSFHADSPLAHRAALAAAAQGKFWQMHDLVFHDQRAIKRDDLLSKARGLNLNMAQFEEDLDSNTIKHSIEADQREGNLLGVSGTPTFFINGKRYTGALPLKDFQSAIDLALAQRHTPDAKMTSLPDITLGAATAPVTMTWFSDLGSSLSLKATLLVERIVHEHPGVIRVTFKNLPLESHSNSMMLHEAALAAGAQGKFWQMHDRIVGHGRSISRKDLVEFAEEIGLDVKRFEADLETEKYRPVIQRDLDEAKRSSIQGTPVFLINGRRIDGLQSEDVFTEMIEAGSNQTKQLSSR